MKKYKIAAVVAVIVVLLCTAGYKLYLQKQNERTFTGTIEVTKVDIVPKISGYLAAINVTEGDRVGKGTLLAQIESKDYLLQLEHDQAALAGAEAILEDLRKGARTEELEQAAAQAAAAASVYRKSERDWRRYAALYDDGAVSRQQYDEAENAVTVAERQLEAAEAALRLLEKGTREDQLAAQQEEVKRCEALVQQSERNVAYTELTSPVDGLVLTKNYETGEYVTSGAAVMTVADMSDCWVKIYLPSEMLGKIVYGQQVKVRIDAFPDRDFSGSINEISDQAEYTPRQSITARERANMVFYVKVRLDNETVIFKPGMIADVMLDD